MIDWLPTLNATLNGTAAILLTAGWIAIKRRNIAVHKGCMIAAVAASACFLTSYLIYHYHAGSRSFTGLGLVRPVYFGLLISHIILAVVMLPPILIVLWRAWKGDFARHARLARWTLPVWMYVSVTGVIIYLMLYHWPL